MVHRDRGFSLPELMTTVAVIGILTAIVVPTYRAITNQAREAVQQENTRTLDTKVRLLLQEGTYDLRLRRASRADPDVFLSRRLQEDLEAEATDVVDTTLDPIQNPVSGNDNVMIRSSPNTNREQTPPAVFITGSARYRHERARRNESRLAGSIVIVLDRRRGRVELYYMDPSGRPSDDLYVVEAE